MRIFILVKISLFFFLCLSFSALGQENSLIFYPQGKALSAEDKHQIKQTIGNEKLENFYIEGFVYGDNQVSNNRILLEYQIQSVRQYLEDKLIGSVSYEVSPIKIVDSPIANKIKLTFQFHSVLGEQELKNTKVVRIVRRYDKPKQNPKSPIKVELKKEEPNSILAKERFKKGETIRIPNLIFNAGSAILKSQSKPSLRELFSILYERPTMNIELHGHVCCEWSVGGSSAYVNGFCQDLSEARAKAVYSYLVSKGIDAARLRYVGFGYRRKIKDDYGNPAAANLNRRVEILVVSE